MPVSNTRVSLCLRLAVFRCNFVTEYIPYVGDSQCNLLRLEIPRGELVKGLQKDDRRGSATFLRFPLLGENLVHLQSLSSVRRVRRDRADLEKGERRARFQIELALEVRRVWVYPGGEHASIEASEVAAELLRPRVQLGDLLLVHILEEPVQLLA